MTKRKSKAIIMVADGAGGMKQVVDRRFEPGEWPISSEVPAELADSWLKYLAAECGKRGWSCSSFAQMDAKENSGSITIERGAGLTPITVVWERKRGKPMSIRARLADAPGLPVGDATELFDTVNEQCRAGAKEMFYVRGQLQYEGLAWRGELWFDDNLRLGPPSRQDEAALFGPRIILVDARAAGIDFADAHAAFSVMLRELSVFLSIVMRRRIGVAPNGGRTWTFDVTATGTVECDVRNLGYVERDPGSQMPKRGQGPPIGLRPVPRPDLSITGVSTSDVEQELPADIVDLWQRFSGLSPGRRQQFLGVGSMWQAALALGHEFDTASFVWMVCACEALKPRDREFRDHNLYQVVEALLGKPTANLLQEEWFRPQAVRHEHLHAGELHGSEFVQHAMMSSFRDPTFGEARRLLAQITPAAVVEWLKRDGMYTMPPLRRRRSRGRGRAATTAAALAAGVVLGWLIRMSWPAAR